MFNEGKKAFDTNAAVAAKLLLAVDANGDVGPNDGTAANSVVGVSEYAAASGAMVGVSLINRGGTVEMTANEAITVGEEVYAAPAGKIQDLPVAAADYRKIGIALEAATADGDVIEVLPYATPVVVTVV